MARKPDEADAGFAIGIYDQGIIESNADERFGRGGDPEDRKWAEEEGLFNNDAGTREGTITAKGWDLLNEDVAKIEKNAMAWMKKKFIDARDEGHGGDDLVGTFWFDPLDTEQAHLVELAADTGRQERIDMVDLTFGDLAKSAFDGVSDFGAWVLGGAITFFGVKPEDMEVVEQTIEVQRRRDPRAREARPMVRARPTMATAGSRSDWEVVVGNIGTVYRGSNNDEAISAYMEYFAQSKSRRGRAGGESVTLFRDGEPYREHVGDVEERRPSPHRSRSAPTRPTLRRPPARRR